MVKAGWIILLALTLGLCACRTPEERAEQGQTPSLQEDQPDSEGKTPDKANGENPAPTPTPAPAPQPSPVTPKQTAPILVKALIHSINRVEADDLARYQIVFNTAEVVRGRFPLPQAVVKLSNLRKSFPWIIDDEFEGGRVFIHIKKRRGKFVVVGFSGTVSGAITPYR